MSSELKPGYKYTDLGIIPESWEVCDLKTLRLDISDGNYSSKYPKASDFKNIGIPFIRANNISALTVLDLDMRFISKEQHQDLLKGHLKKNDLLITTRGEIGQIAFVPDRHIGSNINAQIVRINTAGSPLAHKFLGYYLLSGRAQEQIQNLQTGSALKQLPVGRLLQVKVAIPPADIQEKIAESLYAIDTLINSFDQLIAKKRDIQQATMQQLLTGQRRLPGFNEEWQVRRLGEIGEISGAGVDKKIHSGEEEVRLLNYTDVYKKDFLHSPDFNHMVTAKPEQITRCAVKKGDVFFTPSSEVRDDIGHAAVSCEDMSDVTYSYHVVRLRPKAALDIKFLGFIFRSKNFKDQASTVCEGSGTRYVITLPKFRAMTIRLPLEIAEQAAIGEILFGMSAELAALECRRDKAHQIKQGMMQELLTGRIRLV